MVMWNGMRKFGAIAVGTGVGLGTYFYQKIRENQTLVQASWTNSEKPVPPSALWDSNWDFRSPKSIVRPIKNNSVEEENRYNSELEKKCPKHVRHIILVRHGEYLDEGDKDEGHHLTERGRIQAKYTGQRLRELIGCDKKWDRVIASTMTRAQETAEEILKEIEFDPKEVRHCPYIREGAPIPPQPPVGHWRPEESVSVSCFCFSCQQSFSY